MRFISLFITFLICFELHAQNPEWIVYNTSNSGLTNTVVLSVSIGQYGTKWLGTYNELASFNNNNWTIYNQSNSQLCLNTINVIYVDKYDNIWLGPVYAGMDDVG